MEALTSLGVDVKLLIAQIVNFLVLLVLLRLFLYKPIVNMLEERKKKIERGLKDAENAKTELEKASEESKRLIAKASAESEKIVKQAKKEIEEQTQNKIKEAQLKAEQIVELSRKQAAQEQNKIVEKAKKEITDLAVSISEKILERNLDKEDVDNTINKI